MKEKEALGLTECESTLVLKYNRPATEWMDGLAIGNGRLAAMVCGTEKETERLALNHERLYKGIFLDRTADEIPHENLEKTRRLLFEHKYREATVFANRELADYRNPSVAGKQILLADPPQPAGDLTVTELDAFGSPITGGDFSRRLDLRDATVTESRTAGGVIIKREFFASQGAPHNVCIRLSASKPIAWRLRLDRKPDPDCTVSYGGETDERLLTMHGEFTGDSHFTVALRIESTDGKLSRAADALTVSAAKTVTAYLMISAADKSRDTDSGARSFHTGGYESAYSEHKKAYSEVFDSCRINVSVPDGELKEAAAMTTDALLDGYRHGRFHSIVPILYFNFGRYLLISSSGELPAHLQGKWNEELLPPWNSDFHCNINLQMNYWMAETVGLSRYTSSLFNLCEGMIEEGKKSAMRHFGCRGVLFPLATDCHGKTIITVSGWDIFVGIAAWLGTHYWMHWQYTRDRDFLVNRAYPFFRLLVDFYEDYLCTDPDGGLQIVPSQSPENRFAEAGEDVPVAACISSAIDIQLCSASFDWAIFVSDLTGIDSERCKRWREIRSRLPRMQIGDEGELLEWTEKLTEVEPGHRHFSHLVGVYPIDIINERNEPELFRACRVSLDRRMAHGGGHTGWSRAWVAGLYARFGDSEKAWEHLKALINDFTTDTLLDLHPPRIFQIDVNFGGAAAIAEMLIQSYGDVITLLPALPSGWSSGKADGFHCRGGFTVDFEWEEGAAKRATVFSSVGGECVLNVKGLRSCSVSAASVKAPVEITDGSVHLQTCAGARYYIEFDCAT